MPSLIFCLPPTPASTVQIQALTYHKDISAVFRPFADAEHAALFDSGKPEQAQGRYDIFSAWPTQQVRIQAGLIEHQDSDKTDQILPNLAALKSLLSKTWQRENSTLPFCGGWIGFASYELGYYLEPHMGAPQEATLLPAFWAGYYNWAVIADHEQQLSWLCYEDNIAPCVLDEIQRRLQQSDDTSSICNTTAFQCDTSQTEYNAAFDNIQQLLSAGDCYQVNYAMRYQANFTGDAFAAYRQLRTTVPSPFMSYLQLGQQQIISISPERFICADGQHIQTRPIKGTAARSKDNASDRIAANKLQQSIKNRAENLMIVDLLRNDLGKYCQTGSVSTDELFAIESFSNVHHLVSTISGTIDDQQNIWDVFFGCFPGGSITGAPKIRACQVINELEVHNREIYCGSIFYASNHGRFDANIAIRTLLCNRQNDKIYAWAGGGIVKDSEAHSEWQECQDKIGSLLNALHQADKGNAQ